MVSNLLWCLFLGSLFLATHQFQSFVGDGPVVPTLYGPVMGQEENGVSVFRGVPYATSPPTRFKPPVPPKVWKPEIMDATQFKDICLQSPNPSLNSTYRPTPSTEDCLYLNIWSPNINSTAMLPVMVFIHGGGYYSGAGSDTLYDGTEIAYSDAILVTFNYRLGVLGFLYDPLSNIQGNMGILDQREALIWVRDNIVNFGGDPNRVTLFGQSAGGISVSIHLTTPLSFGLFSNVIVHSSPPVVGLQSTNGSAFFKNQFLRAAGCSDGDTACLMNLSQEQILAAQSKVAPNLTPPLVPQYLLPWMPVIDGNFIIGSPLDLILAGEFPKDVGVIWGSTPNETSGWIEEWKPWLPIVSFEYKEFLNAFFGNNSGAVYQEYPAPRPSEVRPQMAAVTTDWMFTCSVRSAARSFSSQNAVISRYLFLHQPSSDPVYHDSVSPCAGDGLGDVCHGEELTSVFETANVSGASFTSEEMSLSKVMLQYWTDAAKNGVTDPWPIYESSDDLTIGFNVVSLAENVFNYNSEKCDFWDSLGVYDQATS
eukprot:CAMPEP_0201480094 /NCGR_PEP_ID=MMETSP0151_2-20130828/4659_1 /ASSEMBLY_ACC=CAM_ASM_000257 /TAXON_ID=200890 /ORGANISM="Paramoeba atlantica, Strain 621/1 / CCAP 1560/9" /LENGTH=536 /DNA_ID=CAMNT_0047861849 /DNA_START=76 /DNA_END=1686 /DNA_ORIENTATION=+